MTKILLALLLLLAGTFFCPGQTSKTFFDSVIKNPDHDEKAPIVLPYVDPSDVIWARTIIRELVLREKMNLPLYYPTRPMDGRMSLIDMLLKGIQKSFKTAYADDELQTPVSYDEILSRFGGQSDTITKRNTVTGEMEKVVVEGEIHTDEVKRLLIKELWYVNRKTSRLEVRIIALCPVREYTKEDSYDGILKSQLFWVDYGEFRDLLSKQKVFNSANDAVRLSFDDIFLKRYFSSRIIQESNVYDNRTISSYAVGMDAVLESDGIRDEIFNYEQDLWEY